LYALISMNKFATPRELLVELRSLIATIQSYGEDGKPDRHMVAEKLDGLANRMAGDLRPKKMAPISYTYDHPSLGKLLVNWVGRDGWVVIDASHKVLVAKLLPGLQPMDNPRAADILQRAVDKAL